MTLELAEVGNRTTETVSVRILDLAAVRNTESVLVAGSGGRDAQTTDSEEVPVEEAGKNPDYSYTELSPGLEDDSP